MKTLSIGSLVVLTFAGLGFSWWSAEAGQANTNKWEYHCVQPPGAKKNTDTTGTSRDSTHDRAYHGEKTAHPNERVLNHLGAKGWELVAIDPNNSHYCFKRQIP